MAIEPTAHPIASDAIGLLTNSPIMTVSGATANTTGHKRGKYALRCGM